jgi:urease accessory protein
MNESAFLRALHLNDGLLPTGGFAHSDGLESAVSHGGMRDAGDLGGWMRHYVDAILPACDGPALLGAASACANEDWTRLAALDQELTAIKPAAAVRAGSRVIGRRLLATWSGAYPSSSLAAFAEQVERGGLAGNLQVVYGAVCASAGIGEREMVLGFGYGRLAGTASAALRVMPIGQQAVQRLLSDCLADLPAQAAGVVARGACPLRSFSPRLDIEQMTHGYVYSKMFRS